MWYDVNGKFYTNLLQQPIKIRNEAIMGLIADIVEENRERMQKDAIDPCMILNKKRFWKSGTNNYKQLQESVNKYEQIMNEQDRKHQKEVILAQIQDLLQVQNSYLLAEKALLEVIRKDIPDDGIVTNDLKVLLPQVQNAYYRTVSIIANLKRCLPDYSIPYTSSDEQTIRNGFLEMIMNSLMTNMQKQNLDTMMTRKAIRAAAAIIRVFEEENYAISDKEVFRNYCIHRLNQKYGHLRCANCDEQLLAEFPYCLRCYERN